LDAVNPRRDELTPEQREKQREYGRRYRAKNLEKRRAQDRERQRQRRKANPEKMKEIQHNAYQRAKERNGGVNPWLSSARKWRHGSDHEEMWAAFWEAQDGKCYLCGEPLNTESHYGVQVDHDHTCCPKNRTCPYCRRGLACDRCNKLIGIARDDPDLLRRIADNLEPVLLATRARIATKQQQDTLWPEEEAS